MKYYNQSIQVPFWKNLLKYSTLGIATISLMYLFILLILNVLGVFIKVIH
jgi:hypothetical protein